MSSILPQQSLSRAPPLPSPLSRKSIHPVLYCHVVARESGVHQFLRNKQRTALPMFDRSVYVTAVYNTIRSMTCHRVDVRWNRCQDRFDAEPFVVRAQEERQHNNITNISVLSTSACVVDTFLLFSARAVVIATRAAPPALKPCWSAGIKQC